MTRIFLIIITLLCSACFSRNLPFLSNKHVEYAVKKGDTLGSIGQRFHVSPEIIAEVNDISDPKSMPIGLVLKVPLHSEILRKVFSIADRNPNKNTERASLGASSLGTVNLKKVHHYVGTLRNPVPGARFSSAFGWRSLKFHEGVDLAAPSGTKIYAAHSGTVIFEDNSFNGYGKIIVVKGEEFLTVYAHNKKNRVSVGDTVKAGEWIGDVGRTGDATGCHVHFETRVRDEKGGYAAVDPVKFIPALRDLPPG